MPQAHGGVLVPGAGRGAAKGAPNAGRPKDKLRAAMRSALAERLHIAAAIADDDMAPSGDRIRALEFMAKYGLGPRNTTQKLEYTGKDGTPLGTQVWIVGGKEMRF